VALKLILMQADVNTWIGLCWFTIGTKDGCFRWRRGALWFLPQKQEISSAESLLYRCGIVSVSLLTQFYFLAGIATSQDSTQQSSYKCHGPPGCNSAESKACKAPFHFTVFNFPKICFKVILLKGLNFEKLYQSKFCWHLFLTYSTSKRLCLQIVHHRGLRYMNINLPYFVIFSTPWTLFRFTITSPAKSQCGSVWTWRKTGMFRTAVKTTVLL
jgi:hypothetical protein